MSHGTKIISIPFKSLIKFKNLFHFTIWPGCTETTPTNRTLQPSLVNETRLVSARHPGCSFPVHHPWEAVSHWPMTIFPPPCLCPPLLMAHKKVGSSWWHYHSEYVPGNWCLHYKRHKLCLTIVRIHRLVCFWFFLVNFTWFILISCLFEILDLNASISNLWLHS